MGLQTLKISTWNEKKEELSPQNYDLHPITELANLKNDSLD